VADQPISSLDLAEIINGEDLFVLEQNGEAKKLLGSSLLEFIDRNLIEVTVHELAYTSSPTASYDYITGRLSLGIPKGNSIVAISMNSNDEAVFTWADGSTVTCGTFRGPRGMSAYDYAVEKGYTGTETDFATLQLNLYNASLNENERVQAEAERQRNYTYMMNQMQQKLDDFDYLMEYADTTITGTTLILNRTGVSVVDTTLLL